MTRRMFAAFVALFIAAILSQRALGQVAAGQSSRQAAPTFQVDPSWPQLPNNWVTGRLTSVAVDRHDNVWLLHRPRTVPADRKDRTAPAVLAFDASGKFLQGWGGPSEGYEWPSNEHGITVDHKDNVWIGGSGAGDKTDDVLLKFTAKGKFLLQIGHLGQSTGNNDTRNLKRPADVFVYPKTNEAFVADGYGNRRVIVYDADTGRFKRMWGAFGNTPIDAPPPAAPGTANTAPAQPRALDTEGPGPQQFGTTHGIKVSNDGLVYVGDRDNRRIQVFTVDGKYVTQVFVNRRGPSPAGVGGVAFSPDKDQQFMYLADFGNSRLAVLNRKTLEVLYQFGNRSANPGDFQGVHHLAVDSQGNLYTAEVDPGNRAQRFVYKGLSSPPATR